ncbi:hypothetical protein XaC1_11 [Xanthomonas phage XaC1]|nr:hypothetical protein XaC1_11 [Xanthomonas phage XaC1]
MGSYRITNKDINEKIDILNEMFKNRGVEIVFKNSPRNDYAAVDYRKGEDNLNFISGVSNRECYNMLECAISAIHLLSD